MNRDLNTGQFVKVKQGTKTPRMLEVEKLLTKKEGKKTTLEQDYRQYYFKKNYGQKKLSNRWGVSRSLIFGSNIRRGWIDILSLKKKGNKKIVLKKSKLNLCELCDDDSPLEKAHFIPRSKGGSNNKWNLIKLCGSCHKKFDIKNQNGNKILKIILRREINDIIANEQSIKNQETQIYNLIDNLFVVGKKYRKI